MQMVITVAILVFSLAALAKFAVHYLRTLLLETASQPLSEKALEAGLGKLNLGPEEFEAVLNMHRICPPLEKKRTGLALVRAYYHSLRAMALLAESKLAQAAGLTGLAGWVQQEMAACTRYAAVMLDQRLAANLATAAKIQSY
jgi:hypothetical protein